jgi:hypothetical protein
MTQIERSDQDYRLPEDLVGDSDPTNQQIDREGHRIPTSLVSSQAENTEPYVDNLVLVDGKPMIGKDGKPLTWSQVLAPTAQV